MKELFGKPFTNFVQERVKVNDFSSTQQAAIKLKIEDLKRKSQIEFPDFNDLPYHARELFEYFKGLIKREDIISFAQGEYFKDNIINVYFKMLEKASLVLQGSFNFHRATTR